MKEYNFFLLIFKRLKYLMRNCKQNNQHLSAVYLFMMYFGKVFFIKPYFEMKILSFICVLLGYISCNPHQITLNEHEQIQYDSDINVIEINANENDGSYLLNEDQFLNVSSKSKRFLIDKRESYLEIGSGELISSATVSTTLLMLRSEVLGTTSSSNITQNRTVEAKLETSRSIATAVGASAAAAAAGLAIFIVLAIKITKIGAIVITSSVGGSATSTSDRGASSSAVARSDSNSSCEIEALNPRSYNQRTINEVAF